MNSFLEYLARGWDGPSLAGKFGSSEPGGVVLRPPCPLAAGGKSAYAAPAFSPRPAQQQPPLAPCALASEYSLLSPEAPFAAPGAQGEAAGAPVHYATSVFSGGGGGAYLQVDYSPLAQTFQPGAKEAPPPPPSDFCPQASSPAALSSTFEWMKVKRNAPPRSKCAPGFLPPRSDRDAQGLGARSRRAGAFSEQPRPAPVVSPTGLTPHHPLSLRKEGDNLGLFQPGHEFR